MGNRAKFTKYDFKNSKLNQVSSFPGNKIDWRKHTFFLSLFLSFRFRSLPIIVVDRRPLLLDPLPSWDFGGGESWEEEEEEKKDRLLLLRFSRIFSRPPQKQHRKTRIRLCQPSESESITGSGGFPSSSQRVKYEISSLGIWEWIIIEEVIWELYSTVGCFPTCLNVISDCFEVKVEKQYFCQLDHVSSQFWSEYLEIRVHFSFLFLAGNRALRD